MEDPGRSKNIASKGNIMRVLVAIAIGFCLSVHCPTLNAQNSSVYEMPVFRSIDPNVKAPSTEGLGTLRLLADEDFPPFSFRDGSGNMTGLTVELALALCSELGISCEVVAMPWNELRPALESGKGNAIISGLRMNAKTVEGLDTTRPFYRALGRFASRQKAGITEINSSTMTGKKVGIVEGSAHAAWLERYFPKTGIVKFADGPAAREALRTGQVELVFGDALELIYWSKGKDSQNCCELVPGAFVDADYFSHAMSYVLRRGDTPLRVLLDYGLDRMQSNGRFAEIFRRYVPLNPW